MNEYVWTLDAFLDKITRRKREMRELEKGAFPSRAPDLHQDFEHEGDAWAAMERRAGQAVLAANQAQQRAMARHKKCVARLRDFQRRAVEVV